MDLLLLELLMMLRYFADQKPGRGDLIVFPYPLDRNKEFVKRVVGLPGELLEIRQQQVFINNNPLDEPYVQHTEPLIPKPSFPRDNLGPVMIPEGQLFVLGDNRENSNDSRMFGYVEIKDIEREIKIIYWSWNDAEEAVRWERIGKIPK